MTKFIRVLALGPLCLGLVSSCNGGMGTIETGAGGAPGGAGSGPAGSPGTTTGFAGNTGSSGTAGTPGTTTGVAGDTGSSGSAGTPGTTTGTAGTPGTTTGTAGTLGTAGSGATTGAGGSGTTTGTGGTGVVATKPSGSNTGCGMPPASGDSTQNFVLKTIHITTPLDPVYLKGGAVYNNQKLPNGGFDYQYRPYSVRLPKGYDPSMPYAVTFGGGGCGGSASSFAGGPGGGLQIDHSQGTLQIGLSYLAGCFDDGGGQIDSRSDTPEEPYFRAVLADVEAHYCVDKGRVFVSGYSSGGWEAYTLGCAAGDLIRGISTDEGGMRIHRPTCKGPIAAMLVAGQLDTTNPIGPLAKADTSLDSFGSAPGRDDILMRNGCVSSDYTFVDTDVNGSPAHTQWDPVTYTVCVKYTGCPAAYPVVWCALPNAGHNNSSIGNTNYTDGGWQLLGSLPKP
jgi:hypothetical protein